MTKRKGGNNMALLKKWRDIAYSETTDKHELQKFWARYFEIEKAIYQQLLQDTKTEIKGTVIDLAKRFDVDTMAVVGFLDGINDSLKEPNPIDTMDEETVVSLAYDPEKLYKNMVAAGADWLYTLEEWNAIFDEEKQKELYREQKASTTIVKDAKVYPNDPCPCGSGKKYKKCCGKNN